MKKEWVRPKTKFVTDSNIILECLYDLYGQEGQMVLAGKNIRQTMIFPFLRMLANDMDGTCREVERLHQRLWSIYQAKPELQEFVRQGKEVLGEEDNRDSIKECG